MRLCSNYELSYEINTSIVVVEPCAKGTLIKFTF